MVTTDENAFEFLFDLPTSSYEFPTFYVFLRILKQNKRMLFNESDYSGGDYTSEHIRSHQN